jgi:hypothetical protein
MTHVHDEFKKTLVRIIVTEFRISPDDTPDATVKI